MMNFKFLRKNDGTEPIEYNGTQNNLLYERMEDLQRHNQILQTRNEELNGQVQRLASRAYPDIQRVRDEQRIVIDMYQHISNHDTYFQHMRIEQATRIARKLLEENLVEHTVRQEDGYNGDYISRMEIRVQNNI